MYPSTRITPRPAAMERTPHAAVYICVCIKETGSQRVNGMQGACTITFPSQGRGVAGFLIKYPLLAHRNPTCVLRIEVDTVLCMTCYHAMGGSYNVDGACRHVISRAVA